MKYFSMFSGIGGFELGIQRAALFIRNGQTEDRESTTPKQGVEPTTEGLQPDRDKPNNQLRGDTREVSCVGYSEIDKHAIKTYEEHFNHENYGDATAINPGDLPDFDLLVGGFPCQAFSVAGKRAGFNDTRGTLFFDIARILKEKQPRHLVLENVKGLLSHDSGKTFTTILGVLTDLGYFVEWQVLNSKDFGVPQNRERVFIVGHLGGEPRRKVFPIRQGGANDINQLNQPTHSNDRVYGTEGLAPTLNTMQGGRRQPKIAPTLRANHHNTADVHFIPKDTRIRRLTPLECERLQGFPDNWTVGSDTQRYKQCGNAVTVNAVEAVMTRLRESQRTKLRGEK